VDCKIAKKTVRLSERDSARIAQYFPYPVDERDWRNDRQVKTGDVISNDKKIAIVYRFINPRNAITLRAKGIFLRGHK
jgi:hypothetical protein